MADEQGASFLSLFTTFGTFSIAAGIMLIFLIFVMLAAERRTEMGIARAVGTRRGHLVEGFVFEGLAYDVVAAAVGAALGLAVVYAMVSAIATALSATSDIELSFSVEPRSVDRCLRARRGPDPRGRGGVGLASERAEHRRRRPEPSSRGFPAFRPTGAMGRPRARCAGCSAILAGVSGKQATPLMLGLSLAVIGVAVSDARSESAARVAYTGAGTAVVVLMLLPFHYYGSLVPGLQMDFSTWIVAGLLVVLGAVGSSRTTTESSSAV